jgi:hypothetical protein
LQDKPFTIFHPEDEAGFFLDVLDFGQVVTDEAVGAASQQALAQERDRFIVSYYLLLRYGDSVNISRGNIVVHDGRTYYRNVAEKTAYAR